ncbi:hypothetical protein WJX73_007691 [Symbiochloris irregularis]|uniref:Photosystem I subunit O n=1 Tax=Symbiochloris irregularis TaxID=706552 RepID=A0AAW1NST2_9CHLO
MAAMGLRLPAAKSSCLAGFMGAHIAPALPQRRSALAPRRLAVVAATTPQNQDWLQGWLRKDPYVLVAAFAGWTIPTATPIPGPNNPDQASFFGNFLATIGDNLSHFPIGPKIDDPFWLYLVFYHAGLFLAITLGQIGWQGRKQGYFDN